HEGRVALVQGHDLVGRLHRQPLAVVRDEAAPRPGNGHSVVTKSQKLPRLQPRNSGRSTSRPWTGSGAIPSPPPASASECFSNLYRQGDGDGGAADEWGPGERSSRVTHATPAPGLRTREEVGPPSPSPAHAGVEHRDASCSSMRTEPGG